MLRIGARLRTLIAAVFVSTVALSATSGAQAATPSAQRLAADGSWTRAYDTALRYWGKTPCSGQVAASWDSLDRDLNALASWATHPGASADTFTNCSVRFNADVEWDYATYCTVAIHEVGHLLGHEHSNEDGNVMSHVTTTTVPACGPPTARASSTTGEPSTQSRTITVSEMGSTTARKRPTCRQRTLAKRRACRKALRRSAARRAAALRAAVR